MSIDFEKVVQNAVVREIFSDTSVNVCFFHFSQAIWRHIQYLGLQDSYCQVADFALQLRQIAAFNFCARGGRQRSFLSVNRKRAF